MDLGGEGTDRSPPLSVIHCNAYQINTRGCFKAEKKTSDYRPALSDDRLAHLLIMTLVNS